MSAEKEARDAEFTAFMQASAPVLLRLRQGRRIVRNRRVAVASVAEVVGTVTIPDHRGTYAVQIDGSRVTYYSVDPW